MSVMQRFGLLSLLLLAFDPNVGFCDGRPLGDLAEIARDFAPNLAPVRTLHPTVPGARVTERDNDVRGFGCRLPGEFERQQALLLACAELIDKMPDMFVEIVRQVEGKIEVVLLVSDIQNYEKTKALLQRNSIPLRHIRFVELPHDTMWIRDYGPVVVKSKGGQPVVIDAGYELGRMNDDRVPIELARLLHMPAVQVPLRLDGGNLLSNGAGLAITTYRLFDENATSEINRPSMLSILRRSYGLSQLEVLEPLIGEPTGHVDMFATFTAQDTVVVGQYDPLIDPDNAVILDRNAEQLSQIHTAKGPLRVVRIPMPSHGDGIWRTYTNVVYANSVFLVPTYAGVDLARQSQALHTYATLLPKWKVVGVDASRIIESAGALHCITMNLGPLDRLPDFPRPRIHADAPDFNVADLFFGQRQIRKSPFPRIAIAGKRGV